MRISALWNRAKPYLFSNSTILLLKRKAGTPVPKINSLVEIKKTSLEQELADILIEEPEQQLSMYKELLKKGNLCFYGYIKQRYVARGWVDTSGARLSYLKAWRNDLTSDSAYIHGLFTVPSERGKHIAQKLIAVICNHLYEKDIYTMVLTTKPQSLKAFYRCGFISKKSITVIYFCFIPIVRVKKLLGEQVL